MLNGKVVRLNITTCEFFIGKKKNKIWFRVVKIHCIIIALNIYIVWANFALGSNSVKEKARPNILYEEIRTSEEDQPMNGRNYHPRRGAAC